MTDMDEIMMTIALKVTDDQLVRFNEVAALMGITVEQWVLNASPRATKLALPRTVP
jgi:hypothetical protein